MARKGNPANDLLNSKGNSLPKAPSAKKGSKPKRPSSSTPTQNQTNAKRAADERSKGLQATLSATSKFAKPAASSKGPTSRPKANPNFDTSAGSYLTAGSGQKKTGKGPSTGTSGGSTSFNGWGATSAETVAKKALAADRAKAGNNGFLAGKGPTPVVPKYNIPDALTGANMTPAPTLADKLLDQLLNYKDPKAVGGTFSGDLQKYIADAKKSLPKVQYDALIKAAQKTAAKGDADIKGAYGALGGYIKGSNASFKESTADAADEYKDNSQAAVDLLKQGSASGDAVAAQAGAQGAGDYGKGSQADVSANNQQDAVSALLAERLGSNLDYNTKAGQNARTFNSQMGSVGQMQGLESRDSLKQLLAQQTAAYRTSQSQENASNALQALQMGQGQFNADRAFYQSQASQNQQNAQSAYDRLMQRYQLAASTDPNSPSAKAAAEAAIQAQGNTDTGNAIRLSQQRTDFINTYLKKFGKMPTTVELTQAGFGS